VLFLLLFLFVGCNGIGGCLIHTNTGSSGDLTLLRLGTTLSFGGWIEDGVDGEIGGTALDSVLEDNGNTEEKRLAAVKILVEGGANPNARYWIRGKEKNRRQNCTALLFALPYPKIVEYLLERGADPDIADSEGNTARGLAQQHFPLAYALITKYPPR
jgi:hypothetical protein